jgi:hypothetical protein
LVVPSASAERSRMRFDMDLEPGRTTVPSIFLMGFRKRVSEEPAGLAGRDSVSYRLDKSVMLRGSSCPFSIHLHQLGTPRTLSLHDRTSKRE